MLSAKAHKLHKLKSLNPIVPRGNRESLPCPCPAIRSSSTVCQFPGKDVAMRKRGISRHSSTVKQPPPPPGVFDSPTHNHGRVFSSKKLTFYQKAFLELVLSLAGKRIFVERPRSFFK